MWEKVRDMVRAKGGEVRMQTCVDRIHWSEGRVESVEMVARSEDGSERRYAEEAEHFVSTMALTDLIAAFDPPPPASVQSAAAKLRYRDFLIVTLILDHADPFPDNWIYIHSPEVKVGRIQNFRAWSEEMIPNRNQASIGMEYFCHEGDGLWSKSDSELVELGTAELDKLGLAPARSVVDGSVIRQVKAYPVYDGAYREALNVISDWLGALKNLQTVGRNGLHRYNNQDHSMLTAMLAARNILGESHDVWTVNVERSYHEEIELKEGGARAA
jgi:protoporphyrinogen oxidase